MHNSAFLNAIADHLIAEWFGSLAQATAMMPAKHGDWGKWQSAIDALPTSNATRTDLRSDAIQASAVAIDSAAVETSLRTLMPWRKGPWNLHGVTIDTEWRSDWKWERVAPHIDVKNKVVLDVGSGNGYFGYRMLGAGAKAVLGVDPTWLFMAQFQALQQVLGDHAIAQLPLTCEALPPAPVFDAVFSMGVLYHRRSPFDHLLELKNLLRSGGDLVLETLVIEGDAQTVLVPQGRYMRMRNVWFLPSAKACVAWLERLGFTNVHCMHEANTDLAEQRSTDWMVFESLRESLDPNDHSLTVEGLSAPRRAIITASKA